MSDTPSTPTAADSPQTPVAAAAAPAPSASSSGPAAQFRVGFASALAAINPIAQKVNLGIQKAAQLAEEQIGTAEKTELPEEYRILEAKVDRIRTMHENLARATTQFLSPGASTSIKLQVADVVSNVAGAVNAPAENPVVDRLRSVNLDVHSSSQVLGSQFSKAGQAIGDASPLGSALLKCGDAHEKLGRARLQMNLDIYDKFVRQLGATLEGSIKQTAQCRKAVNHARVQLDTLKKAAKNKPDNAKVQEEFAVAQQTFDSAVQAAIIAMKGVVASPEPLVHLADFMAAMLDYFQRGRDLLAELAPEIDAIRVAQEARPEEERLRLSLV